MLRKFSVVAICILFALLNHPETLFSHAVFQWFYCFILLLIAFENVLHREGEAVVVSLKEWWVKIKHRVMQAKHVIREKKKAAGD